MFKQKIRLDDLKDNTKIVSDMIDGDVIQITNGGDTFKVMMTQEYYFKLIARLEKAEGASNNSIYNSDKLMNKFDFEMSKSKGKL